MTRVKICGVTNLRDALACATAGADAVGTLVNVSVSPRSVSVERAREIASSLPPFVTHVIVMMPSTAEEAVEAARTIRPGAVQLHGEEPPEMLRAIKRRLPWIKLIKAIHVGRGNEAEKARSYEGSADAILLDTLSPSYGGSGTVHDWQVSGAVVRSSSLPVLLAGGLSPDNVAEAVRSARPFGVDVSSGVEGDDHRKDPEKVRAFVRRAKGA